MGAAGDETVTRRYEFYEYAADSDLGLPTSIDGENGEAMCDEVQPGTLYGLSTMTTVDVAEAGGGSHLVNCSARILVGNYIGAQMVGFDAATALGLIDHLQDGEMGTPYVDRHHGWSVAKRAFALIVRGAIGYTHTKRCLQFHGRSERW
jgi:hypothetical protein